MGYTRTPEEVQLAEIVATMVESLAAKKAEERASGDSRVTLRHRRGELIEVHVDDHVVMRPGQLRGAKQEHRKA